MVHGCRGKLIYDGYKLNLAFLSVVCDEAAGKTSKSDMLSNVKGEQEDKNQFCLTEGQWQLNLNHNRGMCYAGPKLSPSASEIFSRTRVWEQFRLISHSSLQSLFCILLQRTHH